MGRAEEADKCGVSAIVRVSSGGWGQFFSYKKNNFLEVEGGGNCVCFPCEVLYRYEEEEESNP